STTLRATSVQASSRQGLRRPLVPWFTSSLSFSSFPIRPSAGGVLMSTDRLSRYAPLIDTSLLSLLPKSLAFALFRTVFVALGVVFSGGNALAISFLLDPTVNVQGTSTGTAAAGTTPAGTPTSPGDVAAAASHAAQYNGATSFTANYTIALNPDGSLD